MGAFATQFEVALKQADLRQNALAAKAHVSQTQISRYLSGHLIPEMKNFVAILAIFPEEIQTRLLTAYLLDHIPEDAAHLVTVQPADAPVNNLPVYGQAAQGSDLAGCLAWLAERAVANSQVADAVIATVRAMRGEPLNLTLDMDDTPRLREEASSAEEPTRAVREL